MAKWTSPAMVCILAGEARKPRQSGLPPRQRGFVVPGFHPGWLASMAGGRGIQDPSGEYRAPVFAGFSTSRRQRVSKSFSVRWC